MLKELLFENIADSKTVEKFVNLAFEKRLLTKCSAEMHPCELKGQETEPDSKIRYMWNMKPAQRQDYRERQWCYNVYKLAQLKENPKWVSSNIDPELLPEVSKYDLKIFI